MVLIMVKIILPLSCVLCHVLGPFIAIKLIHTLDFCYCSWNLRLVHLSLLVTTRALSHASVSVSSEKGSVCVVSLPLA